MTTDQTTGSALSCDRETEISPRKVGRPAKVISKERLEGLLRLKVPVSRIAADLQVSRQTVYKAMTEYNLIQQSRYTNISETDIRHAVSSIKGDIQTPVKYCWRAISGPKESMFSEVKYARLYTT